MINNILKITGTPIFQKYFHFFPLFITAFIISFLLVPIIGYVDRKYNFFYPGRDSLDKNDLTRSRKIHTEPKAKAGGIAVVSTFLILSIFNVNISKPFLGLIFGVLVLFIGGILDDIFELNAKIQILFQFISAFIIIGFGTGINYIKVPLYKTISLDYFQVHIFSAIRYIPSILITVIFIVFFINAIKWNAGSDGLAEGNITIASIIIGLISIRFLTNDTAILSFIFAGSILGLLAYNFYPAYIYSGSSGKSVYGFIIAVLSFISGSKMATIIIIFSLPLIDAIWVIIYRYIKYRPKNIFKLMSISDKTHFHHKLMELGLSQKQVAYFEYTYTLVVGTFVFMLTGMHKAMLLFIILSILFLILSILSVKLKSKTNNLINVDILRKIRE